MTQIQHKSRSGAIEYGPLFLYLLVISFLSFLAFLNDIYRPYHVILTLVMVLGLWPLARYFQRKDPYNLFVLALTLISIVYYCFQPFLPLEHYESPQLNLVVVGTEDADLTAAICIVAGLATFITGSVLLGRYAIGRTRELPGRAARNLGGAGTQRVLVLLGGLFLLWLFLLGTKVDIQFRALVHAVSLLTLLGLSVLVIQYCEHKLSRRTTTLLIALLAIHASVGIASGFVALVIQLILLIGFSYVAVRKRLPSMWFVSSAVALATLLLMFKSLFRTIYWDIGGPEGGALESAERLWGFLTVVFDNMRLEEIGALLNVAALRIGLFHTFTYVATWTPTYIPFLDGATYAPLLYKLIPRFLMPDKPLEDMGQFFGHTYHFLDPADDLTSVNLPIMIEMYVNGGLALVIGGMALLAIVNALLWRLISSIFHYWEFRLAAHAVLFMSVALIEANFSLVYGGLLYTILTFIALEVAIRLLIRARGNSQERTRGALAVDAKLV